MHKNYESFFRGKPNGLAHNHRLGIANTLKVIAKQAQRESRLKAKLEHAEALLAQSLELSREREAALRKLNVDVAKRKLEDCQYGLHLLRDKVGEHEYQIHHLERLDPRTHATIAYLVHYTVHHPGKVFPRHDFDAVALGFEKFDAGKLADVRRDGFFLEQITECFTGEGINSYYELTDAAKEPRGFYDVYLRYLEAHPAAPRAPTA